jgi:hypothetical protein
MVHYLLAAVAALGTMARTIEAGTASASLTVGVTVVRSCKVESGGTSEAVRLACSKDGTRVNISSSFAPQGLTLAAGRTGSPMGSTSAAAPSTGRGDIDVRLVTLNF